MAPLEYFDCNAMLGRYFNPAFGQYLNVEQLLQEYEEFGVKGGVVFHATARDYSANQGNDDLLKQIEGRPELHPAWVLVPQQTGEMFRLSEMADKLKKSNVRLIRIFCGRWYFTDSLDQFIYGELLELLNHYQVPVMVEFDTYEPAAGALESQVWRDLQGVCRSLPELRLILACPKSTGLNRALFPLFEKHEYLALETSGYQLFGGYEAVVHRFGAQRLLFGTRLPYMNTCLGMAAIKYAEIDIHDKELIAGGNLRRLLAEVKL
jgi:predicted TIM-barrel fold metal-dependent hydrolase